MSQQNYTKLPPYATHWQEWADRLYAFALVSTPRPYAPKVPASIYILDDEPRAWAICKDAQCDYDPWPLGKDTFIPMWPDSVNELDWRLYRQTPRTLLTKDMPIPAYRWEAIARPWLEIWLHYSPALEGRMLELRAALSRFPFHAIYRIEL